ncbi:protein TolQ [Aurantiacibacter gangjinensis]|uniref:Biopolymer transporter ExbB n=1 Tax=Aurantiacibacter gangjinensis TaxID=502682 RepID=A0A0G9MMN2_9SPHN|nr:protein TolQ [Aurantiacibacter gangjinensis]APE28020.1 MotA/TolQ/ExbB proton channel family protein [Aurantiacibacter gangjinensis]KLE31952.1 biopolymer transporter ExbB [Aurantiacibacter gangjinensis]
MDFPNVISLHNVIVAAAPTRLDPLELFLDADIVVQLVIIGLVLASVWVWAIIFGFTLRMKRTRTRADAFEEDFWTNEDVDSLLDARRRKDNPSARVAAAGISEFRRSHKAGLKDPVAARGRVAQALEGQVAHEADTLANRLNFLATTGAVAPFVGLFGTVWGIMNSFFQIGMQQNSSLAVVAPGIAEALFATAIGLFAAIPAVIAYNRLSNTVNTFEACLQRFADRVHAQVSREMEAG